MREETPTAEVKHIYRSGGYLMNKWSEAPGPGALLGPSKTTFAVQWNMDKNQGGDLNIQLFCYSRKGRGWDSKQ